MDNAEGSATQESLPRGHSKFIDAPKMQLLARSGLLAGRSAARLLNDYDSSAAALATINCAELSADKFFNLQGVQAAR